jgi:transcriptional regulatory protein LevR/transcriptional regulator with AAA-type ATPase domain
MNNMNNREQIMELIKEEAKKSSKGVYTDEIAQKLNIQRSNVSLILNDLYKEGILLKIKHKPVLYTINEKKRVHVNLDIDKTSLDTIFGSDRTLKKCVQQAKAAVLYPPNGLHTIIVGPSGAGKTMFAELMHKFAIESKTFDVSAPFEVFNCADYANNSQLLLAHLFGCKKGAFTGADKDRQGLVAKADGGILFLDEIHRLPPDGQEMLFYLIDEKLYTPLGEEVNKKSELLIICATTENIDESLLTAFTRRIPMNIRIPSLGERTLEERFEIICEFFKIQATRIKREISVSANTIRQLLLYECPGNVGQLKSDVQLGCANAFLNSVSQKLEKVDVHCTDFNSNVNQGLFIYKNHSKDIDKLIKEGEVLCFTSKGKGNFINNDDYDVNYSFYKNIEERVKELQQRCLLDSEIKTIMGMEIENYFKYYIRNFEQKINKEELSKIADEEIISLVETFLKKAEMVLHKIFQIKIFHGLCLHLSSSISRIKNNKTIINYNLINIKNDYPKEFQISKELASIIEEKYKIIIPEDEIGFITMFLTVEELESENVDDKPIVVIAMHGSSTASSMAEVVNKLVKANNVYSYDMSLDISSETAYEKLKDIVIRKNQGAGVLLLVDMGSLNIYGELISKDTGIEIRTLDMASTPVAIECSRKAVIEADIDIIYEAIKHDVFKYSPYELKVSDSFIPENNNIIVTLCTTGEGSAITLRNFIESKINTSEYNVKVFAMAWNNKQHVYNVLGDLSKQKNILAIVGTINPKIYGIPFISTYEVFMDKDCNKIKHILDTNIKSGKFKKTEITSGKASYGTFIESLQNEVHNLDLSKFEELYSEFIDNINNNMNTNIEYDVSVSLMVHMICNISKIIAKEAIPVCSLKDILKGKFKDEFNCIKKGLYNIEKFYEITFNDDEIAFILQNIIKE